MNLRSSFQTFRRLLILLGIAAATQLQAQTSMGVLPVMVNAAATQPHITLSWALPTQTTGIRLWKRQQGTVSWGAAIQLPASATSYVDTDAQPGVLYEYSFQVTRSAAPTILYGSLVGGANIPLAEQRGKVLLLVDETMSLPLATELEQLERDLVADGWQVFSVDVPREAIASSMHEAEHYGARLAERQAIRNLVRDTYNTAPADDWSLILFGRIPVVLSGNIGPDGHGTRAWPTDGYYADIDGTWSDTANYNIIFADQRLRNIAGDGKFDQGVFPSSLEMRTGRIDLSDMPDVPTGVSETELLRRYLARNHNFRHAKAPYDAVQRRGIIDDNFGYFSGEAFASSAWRTGHSFFGTANGMMRNAPWFDTLGTQALLFAYACGGGGYNSISGVGTYVDFATRDSKAVFTMTFGSYFGKWDERNSVLRAPLAGTLDSLGLANIWSGRGYVHLQHMALGETIGYSTRFTQNNSDATAIGGWAQNNYLRSITINLMGDPTLRLHFMKPPASVQAASAAQGVQLSWDASAEAQGYHIYRSETPEGPFQRLSGEAATATNPTGSPLTGTSFTDATAIADTAYTYMVRAVRMETSGAGTYANQSTGITVTTVYQPVAAYAAPQTPLGLSVSAGSGGVYVIHWTAADALPTDYSVERRDPLTGVWQTIATLPADTTAYTDTTAQGGLVYHYRVRAHNANGDSAPTATAADTNQPGLVRFSATEIKTERSAGLVNIYAERVDGSKGDAGVNATIFSLFNPPLLNGNLEQWTNTGGQPLKGRPLNWTADGALPIIAEGLVAGSQTSAWLPNGAITYFHRNITKPPAQFELGFVVAAADPLGVNNRSMHFNVFGRSPSGAFQPLITLRTVRGSSAGRLSLQAFDGQAWRTLVTDIAEASVFDESSGTFTTLHPIRIRLYADLAEAAYDLEYSVGDAPPVLLENVNMFQSAPGAANGSSMARFTFSNNLSSAGFGIDEVSLVQFEEGQAGMAPQQVSLQWEHGDNSKKAIAITPEPAAEPQLTDVIEVALESQRGGLQITYPQRTFALISDSAARTLPTPWQSEAIGASIFDAGFAEYANGAFGINVRSSNLTSATDAFRFVYRSVSGDFQLTARIDRQAAMVSAPQIGIMARPTLAANSATDALLLNTTNGMFRFLRSNNGSSITTPASSYAIQSNPYWLRMQRTGNQMRMMHSADGVSWTEFDTARAWGATGGTMYVGMFLASFTPPSLGVELSAYARFDNVSVYTPPAQPAQAHATQGAATGTLDLSWDADAAATLYRIERRRADEAGFTPIAQTEQPQFTDSGLSTGADYEYRIYAQNPAYQSAAASVSARVAQPSFQSWINTIEGLLPEQRDALSDPDNDGMVNLLEYALGTSPLHSSVTALPQISITRRDAQQYQQLNIVRNPEANGLIYTVERSEDLINWSTQGLTTLTDEGDLLIVQDAEPIGRQPRYLRLLLNGTPVTQPQGALQINLGHSGDIVFFGQPFARPEVWRGTIEAISADGTRITPAGTLPQGAYTAQPHYIEVLSGPWAGLSATITASDANSLTVEPPLAGFAIDAETFAIRPHETLETLFGEGGTLALHTGSTPATSDSVRLFDAQSQSHTSYYYRSFGIGGTGWRTIDNAALPQNNAVVAPSQAITLVRRSSESQHLVLYGQARTGQQAIAVEAGLNWVTQTHPVALTLGQAQLYTGSAADGIRAGQLPSVADIVRIYNPAGTAFSEFYYRSGGIGGSGWRAIDNASADTSAERIETGSVLMIRRREAAPFIYLQPAHQP